MTDKPAAAPDDTYSDEEAARRRDATIRAMIDMKPKPHGRLAAQTNKRAAPLGRKRRYDPGVEK